MERGKERGEGSLEDMGRRIALSIIFVLISSTSAYSYCDLVHQDINHYKRKDGSIDYDALNNEVTKNHGTSVSDPIGSSYNYVRTCPEDVNKFLDDESSCIHYSGEISGDKSEHDVWVQKQMIQNCGDSLLCRRKAILTRYNEWGYGSAKAYEYDTLIAALKIIDGTDYETYMNEMEKVKCLKS